MITAPQLVAHAVGDYIIQSDWMAVEKTRRWWPAVVHAATYVLPFLLLTRSPAALAFIAGSHLVIDRYRLARYVVWASNFAAPRGYNAAWSASSKAGFPDARHEAVPWLTTWLLFIVDNILHVICNAAALTYLA